MGIKNGFSAVMKMIVSLIDRLNAPDGANIIYADCDTYREASRTEYCMRVESVAAKFGAGLAKDCPSQRLAALDR
ncbi:hypothetical protein D3Y57_04535 (plasmid) [Sphingomonas paeninsulae]|uniref:Uncharacterized protein n=1 Tax=Sphingomonas paeninsulae TaxID=2319844 RepID=A0A494T8M9_SPHPE|nr:hypothetical protein D3Y57_04535 [Sphingomonas paeninsulae]